MNKDLDFRVWDPTKHRWHSDDNGYIGDSEWIGLRDLIAIIERKGLIIQQFTSLTDRTGKKIYEGDILQQFGDMDRSRFVVTFQNGMFTNGTGVPIFDIMNRDETFGVENISEVIGNISENPELLK